MKKFNNMTAAKKLTILAVLIITIFANINLIWAIRKGLPYYGYTNPLTAHDDGSGVDYHTSVNGLGFTVKKPTYLGYGGFLKVGSTTPHIVEVDEKGNIVGSNGLGICLFVWPDAGIIKYGVSFQDETEELFMQIYIDEDLNYLPKDIKNTELNDKAKKLIKENYDVIKTYLDAAQKMWGLNGVKDASIGLRAFIKNISPEHGLIAFAATAATVFIILNLFWLFGAKLRFWHYTKKLGKIKGIGKTQYQKVIDGRIYKAQKPKYLRYNSVLIVSGENGKTEDKASFTLFIYLKLINNNQYRVQINTPNGSEDIPINGDIEYASNKKIDTNKDYNKGVINKYFYEIKTFLYSAKDFWELRL